MANRAATPDDKARYEPGTAMPKRPAAPDLNDVKYDAFLANERASPTPKSSMSNPAGR